MIALLLSALVLAQDPTGPGLGEPQPAPSQEHTAERTPDPVEVPPAVAGTGKAAWGSPTPVGPRPAQAERPSPRRSDCRNLNYADAHPETCGAGLTGTPAAEVVQPPTPPASFVTPPDKARVEQTEKAAEKSVGARPSLIGIASFGTLALLLIAALFVLLLRSRATSRADVREVELSGPENIALAPAALARGVRGPGKSRWSIRDGRLILNGPAGTLLNGVRLDRAGEIVSTGDTVRLGGAEYRVRIV